MKKKQSFKERWAAASLEVEDQHHLKIEKKAAKKAHGQIVTMEVLASDLNTYLNRGWTLEQFYSKGFTGLRMALIRIDRQVIEERI
jgi:hypothetical protein